MNNKFVFFLGFSKCGTTWIYQTLNSSPHFDNGDIKESPRLREFFNPEFDYQKEYFEDCLSHYNETVSISGEFTTRNWHRLDAVRVVKNYLEKNGVTTIPMVCVRDPIDRFLSNCKMKSRQRGVDLFSEIERKLDMQAWGYIIDYKKACDDISDVFGAPPLILYYENLFHENQEVREDEFGKLENALGITIDGVNFSKKINETLDQREIPEHLMERCREVFAPIYKNCEEFTPLSVRRLWSQSPQEH